MKKTTRRTFVKTAALGGAAMTFSASSYARIIGANERINFAVAGLNGRGTGLLYAISPIKNANIAALCDVDKRVFAKAQGLLKDKDRTPAKTYSDIRKLLENKDIDALVIATPDHWHAPMAIMALQSGKNVYVEKPCCHNPLEGEWLKKVQQKTGKVLQVGHQQLSGPSSIEAMEDIKDGIIGDVYYGKAWYSNTRGSIGNGVKSTVPEWLDWELWQGPAPRKEFQDIWVHYNWHWFWNWGTGEINNNGLHEMDICRWALGVDFPTKVTSSGGRFHFDDDWEFYDTQIANYEFAEGKMITWEGRSCNGHNHFDRGRGVTLHGTDGSILLDRNTYIVYDHKGKEVRIVRERTFSATTDTVGIGSLDVYHMTNFVNAITKGEKLNSNIEEAYKSTLMCHLGNIAQKYGRALHTDPKNGKIIDDKDAMKMWGRKYEKGWQPEV